MFDVVYRYDPSRPVDRRPPADSREAQQRLEEGNDAFSSIASGVMEGHRIVHVDLEGIGVGGPGGAPRQQPFAVVVGCSDARVPTELVFDRAWNELFVVRVAGNVLGPEPLGSVDYAVGRLGEGIKLLVVLGHSHCGAVTTAVDFFLRPVDYLDLAASHHVRSIVNTLFPAVRGAARSLAACWGDGVTERPGYRTALIECSAVINAALSASILRASFDDPSKDLRVVFGVYDLESRRVHVPLSADEEMPPAIRLESVPDGREGFQDLTVRVGGSGRVRRLLEG